MKIAIRAEPLDPWGEITAYQATAFPEAGNFGATCSFVGTMRDFNEGSRILAMELEHYPEMTQRHLNEIAQEAAQRWEVLDILMVHRVGTIKPGDPIVLVAVWSAHRAAAFDACRYMMEDLKSRAPFWKREALEDGSRWVERNTPG